MKDLELERIRQDSEKMRQEKQTVEEKRVKKETELHEHNGRLRGLLAEDFESSFQENKIEQVDDVDDRMDWRDDHTSFDEEDDNNSRPNTLPTNDDK